MISAPARLAAGLVVLLLALVLPARAQDDVVMKAMRDELARSTAQRSNACLDQP